MTATTATPSHNLTTTSNEFYDPEEVVPRDSPLMQAQRPNLGPSPPTPPDIPPPKVSPTPSPGRSRLSSNRRREKVRPTQGDGLLLELLGDNRRPEIATEARQKPLLKYSSDTASKSESDDESESEEDLRSADMSPEPLSFSQNIAAVTVTAATPRSINPDLRSLAHDAVGMLNAKTSEVSNEVEATLPSHGTHVKRATLEHMQDHPHRQRSVPAAPISPYPQLSPQDSYSPRRIPSGKGLMHPGDVKSPTIVAQPGRPSGHGELPPIQMGSPNSETSGHDALPSIRSTLSHELSAPKQDLAVRPGHPSFPHSPPGAAPRMGGISGHASPPISPNNNYHFGLASPYSPFCPSGGSSASHPRSGPDFSSSSNTETPSTEHGSTPGNTISDRMSIDTMTNPVGAFVCTYQGCTAPPFQTQYLLNSHANVHSSARPHYCPVKGCPRSEGGKGFKRKNEMIRHGLVHDSPGYVCPFCPDREHKYPRPDNLQRHVRVHHVDKDKDDPLLRDVLAQRPDGPNRGRRRRGGP